MLPLSIRWEHKDSPKIHLVLCFPTDSGQDWRSREEWKTSIWWHFPKLSFNCQLFITHRFTLLSAQRYHKAWSLIHSHSEKSCEGKGTALGLYIIFVSTITWAVFNSIDEFYNYFVTPLCHVISSHLLIVPKMDFGLTDLSPCLKATCRKVLCQDF